ncbi:MAG: DUF1499 domain-containing protein [Candidatus Binatus sp.]
MALVWIALLDALLAIAMIAVGMFTAHFYLVPSFTGFTLFVVGFLLSILGTFVGLLAIFITRKPERRAGRSRAVMGTVICLLIALPIVATILRSAKLPAINDITTDFDNPPEFVNAQKLQHEPNRDMKYDKAKYGDKQLAGYGPIGPIKERLDPTAAFARVTEVAQGIPSWKITYSDPATYTLEAVATSKLWHFQDDVVIQIRPTPDGASLIEMRSKSRDGVGDFGVNARRIHRFFDRVALTRPPGDQRMGNQQEEQP